jgi:RND family efflux transporter MFP subunit
MPVVRLSQVDVLRLVIPAPESAVGRVHVGDPVSIAIRTLDRTIPGHVARLADRLDADTRTMRVEVDVPNPTGELVPGMYADATLPLERASGALVVPVQAIDRVGDKTTAMVVTKERRIEVRPVTIGLESPDRVAVTAGLKPDELVVIANRGQMKPGMRVTPKIVTAAGDEGGR